MDFEATALADVVLMHPRWLANETGSFLESWSELLASTIGRAQTFVQDNHIQSYAGTLRGLHYQTEHPQGKLIQVLEGRIFDVTVDMRQQSPTFGRWQGLRLTGEENQLLWIPPGFAHGFYILSQRADVLEKCTDFCDAQSEVSLHWNDPELNIAWPLLENKNPQLSKKDAAGISFSKAPRCKLPDNATTLH